MMNQAQRIEAVEKLPDHIGQFVTVHYMVADTEKSKTGKLTDLLPFLHVEIDPYLYNLREGLVKGENRFMEERDGLKKITIPFIEDHTGIRKIVEVDSDKTLYDNHWIIPRFNPSYYSTRLDYQTRQVHEINDRGSLIAENVRKNTFGKP